MKKRTSGDYDSQLRTPKRHKGSNTDLISVDSNNDQSKPPSHTKKREIKAKDKQKEQLKQPFDEKQNEKNKVAFNTILLNDTYTDDEKLEKMAKLITKLQKSAKKTDKLVKQHPLITFDHTEKKLSSKEPTAAEQHPLFIAVRLQSLKLLKKVYEYYQNGYISLQKTQIAHPFLTKDSTQQTLIMVAITVLQDALKVIDKAPNAQKEDIKNCREIIEFILKEEDAANEKQKAQQNKSSINAPDKNACTFVDRLIKASYKKEIAEIILVPFLTQHLDKIQFTDKNGEPKMLRTNNKVLNTKELMQKTMYSRIVTLATNNTSLVSALKKPYPNSKLGLTILQEIEERTPKLVSNDQELIIMKKRPSGNNHSQPKPPRIYKYKGSNTDLISVDSNNDQSKPPSHTKKREIKAQDKQKEQLKQPFDEKQNEKNKVAFNTILLNDTYTDDEKLEKMAKLITKLQKSAKKTDKLVKQHPLITFDHTEKKLSSKEPTAAEQHPLFIAVRLQSLKLLKKVYEYYQNGYISLQKTQIAHTFLTRDSTRQTLIMVAITVLQDALKVIDKDSNAQEEDIKNCREIIEFILKEEDAANEKQKAQQNKSSINAPDKNFCTFFDRLITASENAQIAEIILVPFLTQHLDKIQFTDKNGEPKMLRTNNKVLNTKELMQKTMYSRIVTLATNNKSLVSALKKPYPNSKSGLTILQEIKERTPKLVSNEQDDAIQKAKSELETFNEKQDTNIAFSSLINITYSYGEAELQKLMTFLNTGGVIAKIKKVLKTLDIQFTTLATIASHKGKAGLEELITYFNKPGVFAKINKVLETLDIPFTTLATIAAHKGAAGFKELITYLNKPDVGDEIKKVLATLDIPFTTLASIAVYQGTAGFKELITYLNKPDVGDEIKKVLATLDIAFTTLLNITRNQGAARLKELITYLHRGASTIKSVLETLEIKFSSLSNITRNQGTAGLKELITYLHREASTIKSVLETLKIKFSSLSNVAGGRGSGEFIQLITYLHREASTIKSVLETLDISFTTLATMVQSKGGAGLEELITYVNKPGVFAEIKKVLETLDIPFTSLAGIASQKGAAVFKELITYLNTPDVVVAIKKVLETLDIPFTTLARIAIQKGKAGLEELITCLHNEVNDPKLSLEGLNIKAESILGLLPSGCQDAVKKYQNFKKIFVEHEAELTLLTTKQINVNNLLKWLCGYKPEQNLKIIKSVLTELKSVLTELKSYSTQDLDNWLQDVTKKKIISTLGLKKQSGDVPPDNFDEEKVYDENDPIAEEQLVLNEVSLAVSLQLQDGSVQSKFGCHRLRQSETDNWMPPEAEEFSMLDRYEMDAFMIGDKTLL